MTDKLVQFRMPEEELEPLKVAAAQNGRTLPAEVLHRLRTYELGNVIKDVPRALGALMTMTAAGAAEMFPPGQLPPEYLGAVKQAMCEMLDALGGRNTEDLTLVELAAMRPLYLLRSSKPLAGEPPGFDHIRKSLAAGLTKEGVKT
jgi:hypothetical protein